MKFYPEEHKYIHENKEYPSVTKIISSYFKKFDKFSTAKKYAEKYGLRKKDVLMLWKKKGKIATTIGTEIHEYMETLILGENPGYMPKTNREKEILKNNQKKIKKYKKNAEKCFKIIQKKYKEHKKETEKIVFSEQLGIAGSIDLVLSRNNRTVFLDYKTSKEITIRPFIPRDLTNYTKPVCFPDANFFKYSLQLTIYKVLYKTTQDQNYLEKYYDIDFSEVPIPEYLTITKAIGIGGGRIQFPISKSLQIVHIPTARFIPCIKIPEINVIQIMLTYNENEYEYRQYRLSKAIELGTNPKAYKWTQNEQ